jgi:hypothetical protein
MEDTGPNVGLIWTTKHQKLTLDREKYHTGDVIKGKIEFECIEEPTHPNYLKERGWHLTTIKLHGVFRTVAQ